MRGLKRELENRRKWLSRIFALRAPVRDLRGEAGERSVTHAKYSAASAQAMASW